MFSGFHGGGFMVFDDIELFLNALGFTLRRVNRLDDQAAVPGIFIVGMTLLIEMEALASPGDILHEAGHVAITPELFRPYLRGDVEASIKDRAKAYFDTHPFMVNDVEEDMVMRGLLQAGESEAQAWSYAAAVAAEVDPAVVFHANAYDGEGESLITMLSMAQHMGVHGLMAAKMTTKRTYPQMIRWLQV
jgi:hypothetical protein